MAALGGGDKCSVCKKAVYSQEKVQFQENVYHKTCFKCTTCKQSIRIIRTAQSIHGEPYCEDHYKQKLMESGNKAEFEGVGAAGKSKGTSVGVSLNVDAPKCGVCSKSVYAAEQMRLHEVVYHKQCFKCQTCQQPIRMIKTAQSIHSLPYCEDHYKQALLESGNKAEFSGAGAPGQKATADVGKKIDVKSDQCLVCGKSVYAMELVRLHDHAFHKLCFKCETCKQPIRQIKSASTLYGKLYCGDHYQQVLMESGAKAQFEGEGAPKERGALGGGEFKIDAPSCGVCDKSVYAAEDVILHGVHYHKLCFKCQTCHQPIRMIKTAQSLHRMPYCEDHYKQVLMESGNKAEFGGEGAVGQKSSHSAGPARQMEVKSDICGVCTKSVYAMELVKLEGQSYHKKCFKCQVCKQTIRSIKNAKSIEGLPYCEDHYKQVQMEAGSTAKVTEKKALKEAGITLNVAAQKCFTCGETVYQKEKVVFHEKNYHKKCFACEFCKQPIRIIKNAQSIKGHPYCSDHYKQVLDESGGQAELQA